MSYSTTYIRLNVACRIFFFFKQKTAYEMRISDWSSDVCSSDLLRHQLGGGRGIAVEPGKEAPLRIKRDLAPVELEAHGPRRHRAEDPAALGQLAAQGERWFHCLVALVQRQQQDRHLQRARLILGPVAAGNHQQRQGERGRTLHAWPSSRLVAASAEE